ncbi:MAG: Do family serine endopeptidase [Deltaproteobacteria bacterium]|nr:MAG: Do family serine endopeptidase [Deltaproteobacteria bacterium]
MGRIAVQSGDRSLGGCMHRRFTVVTALLAGAFAVIAALPLVSACQRRASDTSFLAADAQAAAATPTTTAETVKQAGPMPSLAPLVKQLRPVVVNINSRIKPRQGRVSQRLPQGHPRVRPPQDEEDGSGDEEDSQDPMERFFRYFGQPTPNEQERRGLGSGFLIGDGLVLTNNHVVEVQDESRPGRYRPMDEIKVITDETAPGGAREFSAKVIGNDPKSDIAVLRIEGKEVEKLKYATLGDSDSVEVGDYVLAIGEPFGLQATVTSGIISAKERTQFGGPYSDYLQTDASINPGNSGGPLFNLKGEVVGVNAAIISGANTIGFAIPVNVVKQILPQLKQTGRVVRGFLGVQPQAITADMVDNLGLKSTKGALIADVVKDSPAEHSGIKPGDVVVGLNGKPVNDNSQLTRDVGVIPPGNTVKLDVVREGRPRTVEVKLAERPDEREQTGRTPSRSSGEKEQGDLLGLSVQDVTPQLARRSQLDASTKGAVVVDVAPDSPASDAGLEPGDVVVEVNRRSVNSAADYRSAVKTVKKGDTVLVRVKHGQATQYVPVRVK